MIIPWGTDAPLYHRPFVTIVLMVFNVGIYLWLPEDDYEDFVLMLGDGVHPVQWLTNNFLHAGIIHLVGNMIFLWTFGLVVEGKLGWSRFLLVYLGLGVLDSAAMQVLVPSEHEIALRGSSTIVFGLMGMCLVWAPRNEVTCIIWLRFTPIELDLSILWFAAMYIALDVLDSGLAGMVRAGFTSLTGLEILAMALDHTIGALLGIAIGIVMLKLDWVDCENWDIFAALERRLGKPKRHLTRTSKADRLVSSEYRAGEKRRSRKKEKGRDAEPASVEDRSAAMLRRLRQHLELGETEAALAAYQKARRSPMGWQPPERDWRDLIEALLEMQSWDDSVGVMRDYLSELPEPLPRVRLKLAQILIHRQGRPQQALKVLGKIPEGSLPVNLETIRLQLTRRAEAMREEGPLELDEDIV
jgi:membrane associated rhomboid family serine protease